jgi:hypothetical protein
VRCGRCMRFCGFCCVCTCTLFQALVRTSNTDKRAGKTFIERLWVFGTMDTCCLVRIAGKQMGQWAWGGSLLCLLNTHMFS